MEKSSKLYCYKIKRIIGILLNFVIMWIQIFWLNYIMPNNISLLNPWFNFFGVTPILQLPSLCLIYKREQWEWWLSLNFTSILVQFSNTLILLNCLILSSLTLQSLSINFTICVLYFHTICVSYFLHLSQ